MNAKAVILASYAMVALGGTAAQAGPCSEQINSLTKVLASKDAGTGPTSGASSRASTGQAGQHPPTAAMSEQTQGIATSPEDVRRQTAGQAPAAQQQTTGSAEHPPTAAMDQAMKSQAAPPGGQPATAAMSAATESQMPPRETATNTSEASMALDRAREFDRQGKEADCMNAIGDAKRLSGSQ